MKLTAARLGAIVFTLGALIVPPHTRFASAADPANVAGEKGVREANDRFYSGLNKMFSGDVKPVLQVWSHSAEITHMGPVGNWSVGWDQVSTEFKREAHMKLGGKVDPRDILVRTDGDLGYVVCIEHGRNLSPAGKPIDIKIRATSIFRLENGEWKMVHHHTDIAPKLEAAAK